MSNNTYETHNTMEYIQNILMQISIPYIIIVSLVGIAGNVLTIIMLSRRSLTITFNNCTLIALALTDLLFNLTLVSRCISDIIKTNSDDFCRILSFISHLAELLSACFTAHFTIQRFIAVKFPLSVFVEKNIHLIHYLIVTLFILCGILFCFALIKSNNYDNCEEELNLSWFISDALLSFVIPFTIIAILNLLIIFHLRKKSRNNKQLSYTRRIKKENLSLNIKKKSSISYDSNPSSRLSDNTSVPHIKTSIYQFSSQEDTNDNFLNVHVTHNRIASIRSTTRSHAQSHRVTRMLIIVSTCFLLLNAPAHICAISLKLYTLKKSQLFYNSLQTYFNLTNNLNETKLLINEKMNFIYTTPTTHIIKSSNINLNFFHIFYIIVIITHHISYLSYSINFFLYSFCGIKFRQELMRVLTRYRKYHEHTRTPSIMIGQNSF